MSILLPVNVFKICWMSCKCLDTDQTPCCVASDLGLHCLIRPVSPNTGLLQYLDISTLIQGLYFSLCFIQSLHLADKLPFYLTIRITVFDLITTHAPISAKSSNFVVFRLQPVYFYLLLSKTCCGYLPELPRQVEAIQTNTHNVCFY